MKNIKTFEGFFKKNLDVETAKGILNKLDSLSNLEVVVVRNPHSYADSTHSFTLDDFSIKIELSEGPARLFNTSIPLASDGGVSYKIFIDGVKLNINHLLAKKIYKKVKFLHEAPSRENIEFIKKDAHINFRNHR